MAYSMGRKGAFARKERISRAVVALTLLTILLAGFLTFQDYGFTTDESTERNNSIVTYQYVLKKLTGKDLGVVNARLETWWDRYYGVFLQQPMVLAEHIMHFTMPIRTVFLMRHLWTFLLCFGGWVCFYFFCKRMLGSRWLALFGMLMVVLYPRFWGEQFNNIKDMVFSATVCASLLAIQLCLEHEGKWRYGVLAAAVNAIAINTRVVAMMLPVLLFGYGVLRELWLENERGHGARRAWRNIGRYVWQLVLTFALWILITPAAWSDPLHFLPNTLRAFSNFASWNGTVPFLGETLAGNKLPWYYIPVWLGVSLPIWYLALFAFAVVSLVAVAVHRGRRKDGVLRVLFTDLKYELLCLVIAFAPVLVAILASSTLYNGWRHMYFILPPLVAVTASGVRFLLENRKTAVRRGVAVVLCVLLGTNVVWIVANHPFEKLYFNMIGKNVASRLDRDYWTESVYNQFQYLLARDDADPINVSCYKGAGNTYLDFLTEEEQMRINMVTVGAENEDYLIDTWVSFEEEPHPDFTPVRVLEVDGVEISTLYVRTAYLEERFGGCYPE